MKPAAGLQSWPTAATIAAETSPQDWPKPHTVAEVARLYREKQASEEKAKIVVNQDDDGRMVVTNLKY